MMPEPPKTIKAARVAKPIAQADLAELLNRLLSIGALRFQQSQKSLKSYLGQLSFSSDTAVSNFGRLL
jgi:hypothetical protein